MRESDKIFQKCNVLYWSTIWFQVNSIFATDHDVMTTNTTMLNLIYYRILLPSNTITYTVFLVSLYCYSVCFLSILYVKLHKDI